LAGIQPLLLTAVYYPYRDRDDNDCHDREGKLERYFLKGDLSGPIPAHEFDSKPRLRP
jgi:hypothetical protein